MYKLTLEDGATRYGANMGRADTLPDDPALPVLLHLNQMRMINYGDYDSGGAYWGAGNARIGFMYCAEAENTRLFIRAVDRQHAKAQIIARLPHARFYR